MSATWNSKGARRLGEQLTSYLCQEKTTGSQGEKLQLSLGRVWEATGVAETAVRGLLCPTTRGHPPSPATTLFSWGRGPTGCKFSQLFKKRKKKMLISK